MEKLTSDLKNKMRVQLSFSEYHALNPQVYSKFCMYTEMLIKAGRNKLGAKAIMERCRWDTMIETVGVFKINNNYTASYSKKFEQENPQFRGIFEHRIKRN